MGLEGGTRGQEVGGEDGQDAPAGRTKMGLAWYQCSLLLIMH